ncbi:hypothetical protein JTB14_005323 [Gonioctena quinquepunctata]|nr:hypothetical protein JTB14_005323 [Gonioctena quinquepunctata]
MAEVGVLVEARTKYFSPTQKATIETHTYRNIKPSNGESLNKFLLRLRQQATKCSFGNNADEATEINIKDKIIDDWAPLELKRKLLKKERSLSDIIDLCQIHEQILDQSKVMGSCSTDIPSTSVNKISARVRILKTVSVVGNSHVGSSAQCPARNAKCHKCELMEHFANKCKTKPRKRPNKGNYNSTKRGRMTSSRVNYLDPVLTKPPTLSYFDPKKRTRLIADANPVALGAVLIQFECDTPKVVSFASKGLSDTERRYSQTEKESLALVWAVGRFYFYLTGLEFELVTDHKPLEAIFKPTSRPPAWIERWVLRLQAFKFKVIYQRGKSNIADSISRLCRINDTCTADKGSDLHIFAIVERGTPEAMSISEITAGSLRDPELLYAIRKMDDNSWETSDKNVYYPFRLELTNLGPILLRNNRIVIPVSQRQQILTLAHEGHPGEKVMKRRLRAKVWWPLIDRQVEQFVKHCRDCLLVSRPENHPHDGTHSFSRDPECLALTLWGPLPNQEQVLVVIDYYSRYQSIKFLRTTTSSVIIRHLEELFCQLGIPKSIRADNGRQFSSQEFQDFCTRNNIQLIHTPPYWPQANGEVENMYKSILKRLQICQNNNRNYKGDIQKFIMMHNVTPNGTTGKSPSELIFNRRIRDKIPSVTDIVGEEGEKTEQDEAKENDITVGDRVVVQHSVIPHKLTFRFGTTEYVVTERRGNEVTVTGDGKTIKRHITHVKRIPSITGTCVGTAESELAGSSTTKDGSEHQEASNGNHSSKGEAIRVEPLKLKRRDGMWEPVTTSHE